MKPRIYFAVQENNSKHSLCTLDVQSILWWFLLFIWSLTATLFLHTNLFADCFVLLFFILMKSENTFTNTLAFITSHLYSIEEMKSCTHDAAAFMAFLLCLLLFFIVSRYSHDSNLCAQNNSNGSR